MRLVFDAGPLGYLGIAAHGHADALSVLLSVAGQPVLVDPGTYSYLANPVVARSISARRLRTTPSKSTVKANRHQAGPSCGHATPTRDGCRRAVLPGPQALSGEYCRIAKRGGRYVHRREVSFDPATGEVIVTDELEGAGVHDICLRWHLSDRVSLHLDGHRATVTIANARVDMALPGEGHVTVLRAGEDSPEAWVSHRFEQRAPSITIECRAAGIPFPLRWVTSMRCIITG